MKALKGRRKLLMTLVPAFLIIVGAHICRYFLPYNPFKTSMGEASLRLRYTGLGRIILAEMFSPECCRAVRHHCMRRCVW